VNIIIIVVNKNTNTVT